MLTNAKKSNSTSKRRTLTKMYGFSGYSNSICGLLIISFMQNKIMIQKIIRYKEVVTNDKMSDSKLKKGNNSDKILTFFKPDL